MQRPAYPPVNGAGDFVGSHVGGQRQQRFLKRVALGTVVGRCTARSGLPSGPPKQIA